MLPSPLILTLCLMRSAPRPKTIEDYVKPAFVRKDNKFLQYSPSSANMTEEKYEGRRYIHSTYMGFLSWSDSVKCYASPSKQPSLHRDPEELSDGEREIYSFFTNESNIVSLLSFLTEEQKKAEREKFEYRKMWLFHGLSRNFGVSLMSVFKPHILELSLETNEAKQRCCAEMLAGFVRGAKHWIFQDWQEAMNLCTTVLSNVFPKLNPITLSIWTNAVMRISMDRDPNLLGPIIELLLDLPDLNSTQSSASWSVECTYCGPSSTSKSGDVWMSWRNWFSYWQRIWLTLIKLCGIKSVYCYKHLCISSPNSTTQSILWRMCHPLSTRSFCQLGSRGIW